MENLDAYLRSLFNIASKQGQDWIDLDFGELLKQKYRKHEYPMLEILRDVIIDPKTEDLCVESALMFYCGVAEKEYQKEIGNMYKILIKHKNWIYAGEAATSLLYLNRIKDLEYALKTIKEEKRRQEILHALLYNVVRDIKYGFAINQIIDLVITADEKWMPHVLRKIQKDSETITLELLRVMLDSKYVSSRQKQKVLNILSSNLTGKQYTLVMVK